MYVYDTTELMILPDMQPSLFYIHNFVTSAIHTFIEAVLVRLCVTAFYI